MIALQHSILRRPAIRGSVGDRWNLGWGGVKLVGHRSVLTHHKQRRHGPNDIEVERLRFTGSQSYRIGDCSRSLRTVRTRGL